jgi:hypothetical protein
MQPEASAVCGRLISAAAVRIMASRNNPILFFIASSFPFVLGLRTQYGHWQQPPNSSSAPWQEPNPGPPQKESHCQSKQQPGVTKQAGSRQVDALAGSGRLTKATAVRASASSSNPILFMIGSPFRRPQRRAQSSLSPP